MYRVMVLCLASSLAMLFSYLFTHWMVEVIPDRFVAIMVGVLVGFGYSAFIGVLAGRELERVTEEGR